MTDQPLVSIIVPVYGAEKYLQRCLDSIIAQTFTDWECILVDDGSKDRSGAICDEYAARDKRFRVFHKNNGGVSSARQFGMEIMLKSGSKYAIHADPDDWVEPDMLENLYGKAVETGADMVICDFYINKRRTQIIRKQDPESETPQEVLNALFCDRLHGSLWNKLIRSVCYKEANIRFPQGLNYCEDFFVNACLLLNSVSKVAYLPKAFYHYDQFMNNNAETRKHDFDNVYKTRTGIVCQMRSIISKDKRDWHYYIFEIGKAYDLVLSNINSVAYRSYFSKMPFSVLLYRHRKYYKSFWVIMTTRCHIPLRFARYFNQIGRQLKNVEKKVIGRKK